MLVRLPIYFILLGFFSSVLGMREEKPKTLYEAAQWGTLDQVKSFLTVKLWLLGGIDARDAQGKKPLIYAVERPVGDADKIAIIEALLNAGALPGDSQGESALEIAARLRDLNALKSIIKKVTEIRNRSFGIDMLRMYRRGDILDRNLQQAFVVAYEEALKELEAKKDITPDNPLYHILGFLLSLDPTKDMVSVDTTSYKEGQSFLDYLSTHYPHATHLIELFKHWAMVFEELPSPRTRKPAPILGIEELGKRKPAPILGIEELGPKEPAPIGALPQKTESLAESAVYKNAKAVVKHINRFKNESLALRPEVLEKQAALLSGFLKALEKEVAQPGVDQEAAREGLLLVRHALHQTLAHFKQAHRLVVSRDLLKENWPSLAQRIRTIVRNAGMRQAEFDIYNLYTKELGFSELPPFITMVEIHKRIKERGHTKDPRWHRAMNELFKNEDAKLRYDLFLQSAAQYVRLQKDLIGWDKERLGYLDSVYDAYLKKYVERVDKLLGTFSS